MDPDLTLQLNKVFTSNEEQRFATHFCLYLEHGMALLAIFAEDMELLD